MCGRIGPHVDVDRRITVEMRRPRVVVHVIEIRSEFAFWTQRMNGDRTGGNHFLGYFQLRDLRVRHFRGNADILTSVRCE